MRLAPALIVVIGTGCGRSDVLGDRGQHDAVASDALPCAALVPSGSPADAQTALGVDWLDSFPRNGALYVSAAVGIDGDPFLLLAYPTGQISLLQKLDRRTGRVTWRSELPFVPYGAVSVAGNSGAIVVASYAPGSPLPSVPYELHELKCGEGSWSTVPVCSGSECIWAAPPSVSPDGALAAVPLRDRLEMVRLDQRGSAVVLDLSEGGPHDVERVLGASFTPDGDVIAALLVGAAEAPLTVGGLRIGQPGVPTVGLVRLSPRFEAKWATEVPGILMAPPIELVVTDGVFAWGGTFAGSSKWGATELTYVPPDLPDLGAPFVAVGDAITGAPRWATSLQTGGFAATPTSLLLPHGRADGFDIDAVNLAGKPMQRSSIDGQQWLTRLIAGLDGGFFALGNYRGLLHVEATDETVDEGGFFVARFGLQTAAH